MPDGRGEWVALTGLYQPTENNRAVFGNGVRYLKQPATSTEFMRAVGIIGEPTVEQVLARLTELGRGGKADKRPVQKLYRFLEEHWEGHEALIAEHFRDHKVVCVALGDTAAWSTSGACCWHVPARLREAAPLAGLVGVWAQLEDFFCEKLGVRRSMTSDEWVTTLLKLSELELEASEAGDLARQVYRELEGLLRGSDGDDGDGVPEWFMPVVEGTGVWTSRGEWWRNDGDVFANDDPVLAEVFKESDRVGFIDIAPSELPRFSRLLRSLNIPAVSSASREPSGTGESREAEALSSRLRACWAAISRLVYHTSDDLYEQAKGDGRLAAARQIRASVWTPLLLDVTLNEERRQHRFECTLINDSTGLHLLVDGEEEENWPALGLELGRWLGLNDHAASLVGMVLSAKDEKARDKLLRTFRVHDLPAGELDALAHGAVTGGEEQGEGDDEAEVTDRSEEDETEEGSGESDDITGEAAEKSDQSSTEARGGASGGARSDGTEDDGEASDEDASADTQDTDEEEGQEDASEATEGDGTGSGPSSGGTVAGGTKAPIAPDQPTSGRRKRQRSPGRLITYVEPPEGEDREVEPDEEAQAERDATTRAAVDYVVLTETEEGRRPEVRPHTNPGYDIESFNGAGQSDRFIEVKGLRGVWGERGVTMSRTQFMFAKQHRDRAWLYVVEFAEDPAQRRVWRIRDPAEKATKFGFDHGWRQAADLAPPQALPGGALTVGTRWRCDDGVVGTIKSVRRSPSFVTIRVVRPDGVAVSRSGPEHVLARQIVGG